MKAYYKELDKIVDWLGAPIVYKEDKDYKKVLCARGGSWTTSDAILVNIDFLIEDMTDQKIIDKLLDYKKRIECDQVRFDLDLDSNEL